MNIMQVQSSQIFFRLCCLVLANSQRMKQTRFTLYAPLLLEYCTTSRLTSVRSQAMSFRKFACISLTRPGIIARWPRIWYCELLHRFHSIKLSPIAYQVHQFLHRDPRVPYSSWNCPWASHGCQLPWLLDEDDRFQEMRLSICAFSVVLEYFNPHSTAWLWFSWTPSIWLYLQCENQGISEMLLSGLDDTVRQHGGEVSWIDLSPFGKHPPWSWCSLAQPPASQRLLEVSPAQRCRMTMARWELNLGVRPGHLFMTGVDLWLWRGQSDTAAEVNTKSWEGVWLN